MKEADFKFDSLREVKTCSRSSFKLSIDTWQIDFIFNANLFTWGCHFYWSVCTLLSWQLENFQRTEQNIFGPDITETIVTAPLKDLEPTFHTSYLQSKLFDPFELRKVHIKNKLILGHYLLMTKLYQICIFWITINPRGEGVGFWPQSKYPVLQ